MVNKLVGLPSPFIAAFLTSWLTYRFAVHQKRQELLNQERLTAAKSLCERLAALKRYCEAGLGALQGGDLSPRFESLPSGDPRSALLHFAAVRYALHANRLFLTQGQARPVEAVQAQVGNLCSMEFALSDAPGSPELSRSVHSVYEACARAADSCASEPVGRSQ